MKNWLTRFATVVLATAVFTSCEKDEDKVTVAPSANLTLTASGNSAVLTQDKAAQTALTFNWNATSFALGGAANDKAPAVRYELQVARTSDGFGYPAPIDAGTGISKNVTVEQLNAAIIRLGLAPDMPATVFVRVAAVIGTDAQTFVSAPLTLKATPYKFCPQPAAASAWTIIGPAGNGWSDDLMMRYDCDTKTFTYSGLLKAGEFKFRYAGKTAGLEWKANLGGASSAGGELTQNGSNLKIETAGNYTMVLTPGTINADLTVSGGTFTIK